MDPNYPTADQPFLPPRTGASDRDNVSSINNGRNQQIYINPNIDLMAQRRKKTNRPDIEYKFCKGFICLTDVMRMFCIAILMKTIFSTIFDIVIISPYNLQ